MEEGLTEKLLHGEADCDGAGLSVLLCVVVGVPVVLALPPPASGDDVTEPLLVAAPPLPLGVEVPLTCALPLGTAEALVGAERDAEAQLELDLVAVEEGVPVPRPFVGELEKELLPEEEALGGVERERVISAEGVLLLVVEAVTVAVSEENADSVGSGPDAVGLELPLEEDMGVGEEDEAGDGEELMAATREGVGQPVGLTEGRGLREALVEGQAETVRLSLDEVVRLCSGDFEALMEKVLEGEPRPLMLALVLPPSSVAVVQSVPVFDSA